jgi:S1-C subfamily serine protease
MWPKPAGGQSSQFALKFDIQAVDTRPNSPREQAPMTFPDAIKSFGAVSTAALALLLPVLQSGPASAQGAAGQTGRNPASPGILDTGRVNCAKDPTNPRCPDSPTVAGVHQPPATPLGSDALKPPSSGELYKRLVKSALHVVVDDGSNKGNGAEGSAIVIANNVAVTNCHVVLQKGGTAWPRIRTRSESDFVMNGAEVIEAHPESDICVLKTSNIAVPVPSLWTFRRLRVGDPVYTLGNPMGQTFTWANGAISALRPADESFTPGAPVDSIQYTAPISHGSSGGGLFDEWGRWIGITNGAVTGAQVVGNGKDATVIEGNAQNLNYAIAADDVWRKFGKCPSRRRTTLNVSSERYECSL